MKPPTSPHDALVRHTFSDVEHARGLLQSMLPAAFCALVNWGTLKLRDGSFIDPQLSKRQTDLLYSVEVARRETYIYLLLEHQSTSVHFMAFRVLVYLTRIWEKFRQDNPEQKLLPVIVPLVLHHSERGWTAPTDLSSLVDASKAEREALGGLLPTLSFQLLDLTHQDDAILRGLLTTDLGKLVALTLKYARHDKDLQARLPQWLDLLALVVRSPGGVAALGALGTYILQVNDISAEELVTVLEPSLTEETAEAIMTGAERLMERGRQEGRQAGHAAGRQEGRQEGLVTGQAKGELHGRIKALEALIQLSFGEASAETTARLHNASVAELDLWIRRMLSAGSLDELFAE